MTCLRIICKIPDLNDDQIKCVEKMVAGFMDYSKILFVDKMNFPTLDYYLSGKYEIDRTRFFSNIKCKNNQKFKDKLVDALKKFPEEKLKI